MCGIVAGIAAERNVVPSLIEGLKSLEYRGYDSAGIAILDSKQHLLCRRTVGKVDVLEKAILPENLSGPVGIAHTRWATHGKTSEANAHPHISGNIALVHNGIIENYLPLKQKLIKSGYFFKSETDTEVIAHLLHQALKKNNNFLEGVQKTVMQLKGAFAIVFLYQDAPQSLIAVRRGSPLMLGLGQGENFIASDHLALVSVAQQFIYLHEGDIAEISSETVNIYDSKGNKVRRPKDLIKIDLPKKMVSKGKYRHFMEKEIFEQPNAVNAALEGRLVNPPEVWDEIFGSHSIRRFSKLKQIQIVACGTSYHAGLIAAEWIERKVNIPCHVDIASEFRYRHHIIYPDTLFIALSQSGETADTLEALRQAKTENYFATLTICNVSGSTMVRESDFVLLTRAGPEIGVASTKAFTSQLTVLLLFTSFLGLSHGWSKKQEADYLSELKSLPQLLEQTLKLDPAIKKLATLFADKEHALFIARGIHFPVAQEGALKLKEISYIQAEAYPAGELKHGPLALVDANMPVVVLAPSNFLIEKIKSTIHEVRARHGQLILFTQEALDNEQSSGIIILPKASDLLSPLIFVIPLQLLAYHVAVLKGTDVDQPRNLAKSVTVE
ncbi:glutamine--fructose-6-phosphate transaminase (isomerizing) [Rickettsiella grylli]|uniref:Glutamine--fructose-6-phosphate aminotransferase [isomerizing] n=1 Tax=Rickettsiella grylli TaxID=59196 RepID=A8PPG4_9COXI|nr:glutamine--fructose-6-phosphate transaminase (isomerizing) [Rickettsiella grylli]EDP45912.1 glutamine-fructose-6-phosphate transaminase (isomerizing) [Rickettsiella grylli]